jgi:hypothetical protein
MIDVHHCFAIVVIAMSIAFAIGAIFAAVTIESNREDE